MRTKLIMLFFLSLLSACATPTVTSGLHKDQISDVIEANKEPLVACYEKEMIQNPKLEGQVNIAFVIGTKGNVTDTKILPGTLNDKKVETCIEKVVANLRFPEPNGNVAVKVNYPFKFRKVKGSIF